MLITDYHYDDIHTSTTLKVDILAHYNIIYKDYCFVETGTNIGACIDLVLPLGFHKIISIEANIRFYRVVTTKFQVPNVCIFYGNSADLLQPLTKLIDMPCVFWLDAHGQSISPIFEELKAITIRNNPKDIILIDDMDIVKSRKAWAPHFGIQDIISIFNNGYKIEFFDSTQLPKDILGISK